MTFSRRSAKLGRRQNFGSSVACSFRDLAQWPMHADQDSDGDCLEGAVSISCSITAQGELYGLW